MKKIGIILITTLVLISLSSAVFAQEICEPSDVIIVLDKSGSMVTIDDGETNTRMVLAKDAAKYFVDLLATDDLSGLVSFSTSANLDQGLTNNIALVKAAIDTLVPDGMTCISCGINEAQAELDNNGRTGATPVMVFLSDGYPTKDTDAMALAAADVAKGKGTIIYTIGTGEADQALLEQVASEPTKFSFGSSSDLDSIYEQIAVAICQGTNPICGNDVVEDGEQCDDGNNVDGDGCSANCGIEITPDPYCGDDILDEGEECDDGNNVDGDGCSANCAVEEPNNEVPEFGIIGAAVVLALAGFFIYKKRN